MYMFFAKASISYPRHSCYKNSMNLIANQQLTACGHALDMSEECFGELRESSYLVGDGEALRTRMQEDGYLYLRGFLHRDDVMEARRSIAEQLMAQGYLLPGTDPMECLSNTATEKTRNVFRPDFTQRNAAVHKLLYTDRMMDFYREFFGEPVRHYDFTWLRVMGFGNGTRPHCDVVYMGRGERAKLLTAWTPLGDAPLNVGGLMVLEGSHLQHERLRHYLESDVDSYCSNSPNLDKIHETIRTGGWYKWDGSLSKDPVSLREKLGGRWLTTDFEAGDLLTFTMHTVHGSIDNKSNKIRISTDSRYQPASLPADERWVGENPPGHSYEIKRGRIC
jgi:hypothetical protein